MKRDEIQNCCVCNKGLAHDNSPLFYKIKLETMGLDRVGIQQTHGLEQFFGGGEQGAALASVMGANPDIASLIDMSTKLICSTCFLDPKTSMVQLIGDEG